MSWKKVLSILVVLAAVVLLLRGYQQRHAAASVPTTEMAAVPVKVVTATLGDVDIALKQVGNVEAYSTVSVSSQVDGQLQSLGFVPGAHVRKGAVIAQIDPRPMQAQIEQAQGNLARDQANLLKATADMTRYVPLLSKGYVAQADVDTYKNNLAVAAASIRSDRAAVKFAQTRLGFTHIVAPFDGVLGAPLVYPGAVITANSTAIVVLNQVQPVWVAFALPQDSLPAVRQAQARGRIMVQAQLDGDAGMPLAGTLDFIDNAVNATTSTITLKARFDNLSERLTPGQFVNVTLPTKRVAHAVSVPVIALQSSSNGSFLFVLKADDTIEQRPVVAGVNAADRVVIDQGLAAGERVVTEGQLQLVHGSHVHVSAD